MYALTIPQDLPLVIILITHYALVLLVRLDLLRNILAVISIASDVMTEILHN